LPFQVNVLDQVGDAVIAIDNQHCVVYWNQAATAQYGIEREEAIAQPLQSLYQYRWINPEDEQAAYQALASIGVWKGVNVHIKRNAKEIWVESTVSVLKDEQNNQIGLLAVIRDITERKQAEESLLLSEEKFSKAFRCSPDAIAIVTLAEGRILEVNESFLDLVGYCRKEIIGRTSLELNLWTDPEDRTRTIELFQHQGCLRNLEVKLCNKSGEERLVLLSGELIEIDGQTCTLSILHEITEYKRAEEALRQSEEKFRQLAENIRDVFWITDSIKLNAVYISPAYEQIWGRTRESWYADPASFAEAVHPEDQLLLRAAIERHMLGEEVDLEYRIVQPSGAVRWIHDRAFPIYNELGQIYRFVGLAEDITDRKQAQQERDRFFNLSLDMLLITDFEGYFRQLNASWEKTLGFTYEEMQGIHYTELVHPEDLEATRTAVENQEVGIPTIAFENRYRCKDGSYKWLSWTGVPFAEEGLIYAVARDVSGQKQAEVQIKTSLQEKEILLQEIHHRVKNNMQVICSLLDLQSIQIQDRQTLEMFRESQNRIRSMALIHEKLYESQNLAKVNFADYVHSLAIHLLQTYAIKPDKITLHINVDEVGLNIDTAIPCGLIINELVSNAFKYAFPENTIGTIWIELYQENNQFKLVIGDNGTKLKIPLDLHNSNSLGLQLVKALVNQIRGKMEIIQNPGLVYNILFSL
jgi:PAS domain S-box-containing protein